MTLRNYFVRVPLAVGFIGIGFLLGTRFSDKPLSVPPAQVFSAAFAGDPSSQTALIVWNVRTLDTAGVDAHVAISAMLAKSFGGKMHANRYFGDVAASYACATPTLRDRYAHTSDDGGTMAGLMDCDSSIAPEVDQWATALSTGSQ